MSAEFDENYLDKTNGKNVGAVLLGAALVNQPANPYMAPLVLADDLLPQKRSFDYMNEVDDLKKQLSDALKELETKNALYEELQKKFADSEAANKSLIAEKEKAESEKHEAEIKAFCDKWTSEGIPPSVIDTVKPFLLNKTNDTIKLSDNSNDDMTSIKFFGDLFGKFPKVLMKQFSSNDVTPVELSDIQKAKERGKAIADSIA